MGEVVVDFKRNWFSPSEVRGDGLQAVSGRRFRKGRQNVPESLVKFLPHDAKVLGTLRSEFVAAPKADTNEELRDADPERAAAEAMPTEPQPGEDEDEQVDEDEGDDEDAEIARKQAEFQAQLSGAKKRGRPRKNA
ncbi:MAG: hypothetical protein O2884_08595 [Chloroflexi bacterium]|nr:hypothetical protein [Chloroflexota bacterium]